MPAQLLAKDKGGVDFDPLPAGLHHAVCYGVVDFGTQPTNNPSFKPTRKVCFLWEVPQERIEFTKEGTKFDLPRGINATYTLSLSKKGNLRPMLESWRSRPFTEAELEGFDVFTVLGANCYLNVIHKTTDKTYANVSTVNPLPKGQAKFKPENPMLTFALPEDMMDLHFPANMPEWMQLKVKQSLEYQKFLEQDSGGAPAASQENHNTQTEDIEEDVPFNVEAHVSSLKTCFKCGASKPRTEFYRHAQMGDGLLGKCKTCTKIDTAIHRERNLEQVRQYDRSRAKLPHRKLLRRISNARQTKQKMNARQQAERCIPKQTCVICGALKVEAHHPDYTRPLDVVWLCIPHHRQLHANRFSLISN